MHEKLKPVGMIVLQSVFEKRSTHAIFPGHEIVLKLLSDLLVERLILKIFLGSIRIG